MINKIYIKESAARECFEDTYPEDKLRSKEAYEIEFEKFLYDQGWCIQVQE
jgi:hypothetical protein